MSNSGMIIPERSRDIGDFIAGRLLPFRRKRMIGPFIFIDHMGPERLGSGKYMDIGQHPHIGLSTLTHLELSGQLNGELGILLVDGSLSTDGETLEAGSILFSKVRERCHLRLEADTHLMLFGGEPFPEERHIHWNFVSSDPERIKAARESWRNRDFPMMEGEDSYIPLPGSE